MPPAHGGQLSRRAEAAGDRLGPAPNGATREGLGFDAGCGLFVVTTQNPAR